MFAIDRFAKTVGVTPGEYDALHRFSIDEPERFWAAVWDFFDLGERTGPVLGSRTMPGAQWFPEVSLNYVDRVMRWSSLPGDAIVGVTDDGSRAAISWAELPARVSSTAELLREMGVGVGDTVAAYLPAVSYTHLTLPTIYSV